MGENQMNGFDIRSDPEKGRYIVATKSYEIDDIILEEEPFASRQFSWNMTYGYAACDHCLRPLETITENVRRLSDNPIMVVPFVEHDPTLEWMQLFTECPHCKIRYCSQDCLKEAEKRYHRAECLGEKRADDSHPINKFNEAWKKIHYPPESGSILLIVRLMAMYQQATDKDEFLANLHSFQALSFNKQLNICHKMLGENFESQMELLFAAFCSAYPGDEFEIFRTPDAFKSLMAIIGTNSQGAASSVLAEWVRKVSSLPLPQDQKQRLDEFIDDLYAKVLDFAGEFLNNEGAALYLLQSKINHSCRPNAQSTFPYSNDIIVVKAIAPIQAGEEINISYLSECQLERSRHSRRKILAVNYIFYCDCIRCRAEADDPDETSEDDDDMETDDDNDRMEQ